MSIVRNLVRTFQWALPYAFVPNLLDDMYTRSVLRKSDRKIEPVFIVGVPRSGTTILYQKILDTGRFTYLSNLDSLLYTSPMLMHALARKKKDGSWSKGESSDYGYVSGLHSPSELGFFMRYFLEGPAKRRKKFAEKLHAISAVSQRPVLTKNTFNSLRMDEIHAVLPHAKFIWMRRDHAPVKASILRMRKDTSGSIENWVGAGEPSASVLEGMSAEEQVDYQIKAIETEIAESIRNTQCEVHEVKYEEFCIDQDKMVETILAKLF